MARLLLPTGLSSGKHTIDFAYSGDSFNAPSSGTVDVTISDVLPTLSSSKNPARTGDAVTFTATIPATGTGVVNGGAEFRAGSIVLGKNPVVDGVATLTTSLLPAGQHDITVLYSGNSYYAPSQNGGLKQIISGDVVLSPSSTTVPPRGRATFAVEGGTAPYAFDILADASGATINADGQYTAGSKGSVEDIVRVTDALGSIATAAVQVSAGLSLTPAAANVAARGTVAFTASGGLVGSKTWTIIDNKSGGAIDTNGLYTAGTTSSVVDVVRVMDGLGNTATANVSIGDALSFSPSTPSTSPKGAVTFFATGGAAPYTWTLILAPSGGSIDATGRYFAGTVGGVTDVVELNDAAGSRIAIEVKVGASLALTPPAATVAAGGKVAVTVSGGSGTGFRFEISPNESGATADAGGVYVAGPRAGTDVIRVTDSAGNTATSTITVTAPPPPPGGTSSGSTSGGTKPEAGPSTSSSSSGDTGSDGDSGCAAAPGGSKGVTGSLLLALAAVLVLRRRRRA